jgi:hypothetical protein
MEIKVILVICIFNFFIFLFFDTKLTQMKLDSNEDDVLTIDVNSCDIPNSSGAQSVNLS